MEPLLEPSPIAEAKSALNYNKEFVAYSKLLRRNILLVVLSKSFKDAAQFIFEWIKI